MAETEQIARMAELLSQDVFGEFLWQKSGPINQNWACEKPEEHKVKTHPSDVVFFYDEPYGTSRTYIQTDLKSYARGSITSNSIRTAMKSLAKQVACAEISPEWQKLYVHDGISSFDVCGMLFIYNHDNEYDKDFSTIVNEIKTLDIKLPRRSRVYLVGPDDIFWLNNVRSDLQRMRGGAGPARLPGREHCSFVYPQLVRRANVQGTKARAATMEMLTSPWILLRYKDAKTNADSLVIYLRRLPSRGDDYMYLIDHLRAHELLSSSQSVTVRVLAEDAEAASVLFGKAKSQYIDGVLGENPDTPLAQTILAISMVPMNQTVTSFYSIALGMN